MKNRSSIRTTEYHGTVFNRTDTWHRPVTPDVLVTQLSLLWPVLGSSTVYYLHNLVKITLKVIVLIHG